MYDGMLHTHLTMVGLYLILFLIKLMMLLFGSNEGLQKFRKRTRILEMILPTLFLATGIYLAIASPYAGNTWFIVKMVLVALTIPLGIVTFKRNSKALGILTLLIFAYIVMISFNKDLGFKSETAKLAEQAKENMQFAPGTAGYDPMAHGKYLFENTGCISCHGEDGAKGAAGAADLQKSTLSAEEIQQVITNGRKNMKSFAGKLDQDQIKALSTYVISLRK